MTQQQASRSGDHGKTERNGDQVAKWLVEGGLGQYCEQFAAVGLNESGFKNLLMQEYSKYGVQALEDKQRLYRLIKAINSREAALDEKPKRKAQKTFPDGPVSPLSKYPGLFDIQNMEDVEFLTEGLDEPIEVPPYSQLEADARQHMDLEVGGRTSPPHSSLSSRAASPMRHSHGGQFYDAHHSHSVPASPEKFPVHNSVSSSLSELSLWEHAGGAADNSHLPVATNVAKIKVVVRKRPLNKKEKARKEHDVIFIDNPESLTVDEPKVKVDLTAYVEKHEFVFDAVLDEMVSNDEVYRETVEPIVPAIFERTKATCFAYGQTGSGKTYTMQPLPLRAAKDMLATLEHSEEYKRLNYQLWISFFEIYGGKLFDLLNDRKKLQMREDGKQQVCIVGLKEVQVVSVDVVQELIVKGGASRSTGSTGANEESSRSHAILQMVIKQHLEPDRSQLRRSRRSLGCPDTTAEPLRKVIGKFSFIDLAGSERGADTTDNDRQTRMEGAEINKSLLALKECIRALDMSQTHIPFRGSKLTEVLRDSFVGNSRTVMVSCISPGSASVEHTLNTLRYADRVKSLSKNGGTQTKRENSTAATALAPREINIAMAAPSPVPPVPSTVGSLKKAFEIEQSNSSLPGQNECSGNGRRDVEKRARYERLSMTELERSVGGGGSGGDGGVGGEGGERVSGVGGGITGEERRSSTVGAERPPELGTRATSGAGRPKTSSRFRSRELKGSWGEETAASIVESKSANGRSTDGGVGRDHRMQEGQTVEKAGNVTRTQASEALDVAALGAESQRARYRPRQAMSEGGRRPLQRQSGFQVAQERSAPSTSSSDEEVSKRPQEGEEEASSQHDATVMSSFDVPMDSESAFFEQKENQEQLLEVGSAGGGRRGKEWSKGSGAPGDLGLSREGAVSLSQRLLRGLPSWSGAGGGGIISNTHASTDIIVETSSEASEAVMSMASSELLQTDLDEAALTHPTGIPQGNWASSSTLDLPPAHTPAQSQQGQKGLSSSAAGRGGGARRLRRTSSIPSGGASGKPPTPFSQQGTESKGLVAGLKVGAVESNRGREETAAEDKGAAPKSVSRIRGAFGFQPSGATSAASQVTSAELQDAFYDAGEEAIESEEGGGGKVDRGGKEAERRKGKQENRDKEKKGDGPVGRRTRQSTRAAAAEDISGAGTKKGHSSQESNGAVLALNPLQAEYDLIIATHKRHIQESLDSTKLEMKLINGLEEGSKFDDYAAELSRILANKISSIAQLQGDIARFQCSMRQ